MADRGGGDLERDLSAKGLQDAAALGVLMREKNYAPALALCSSAKRTSQTLAQVMQSVPLQNVQHTKDIYHATTRDLMGIIHKIDDAYDSALIVGHNPTIHEMAAKLAAGESSADFMDVIAHGYKPGTLSVFQIPQASWKDVQAGANRLIDILVA